MLRSALLYLSSQPQVFRFVRNNRLAKSFAGRFVAGETLDEALVAVRALNQQGISASLDKLHQMRKTVEAHTSEGRTNIKVLLLAPFFMLALIATVDPDGVKRVAGKERRQIGEGEKARAFAFGYERNEEWAPFQNQILAPASAFSGVSR